MTDNETYVLSPQRRELWLAVDRLRTASNPLVGAPLARLEELETDVVNILRSVRQYERRNRSL